MSATTDTTPKTKGGWWALSPLAVFLCLYLVTSLLVNDFYKVPITVAFLASSCYAIAITRGLNLEQRIYQFSVGASNKNIMLMVWIFILAGAFAQSAKQMGAIDATVNLTLHILPDNLLLAGIFIAACFISLSIGTSVGTIVALTPVAVGLAEKTGIDLPYMVAIVVGGSFFGDNLSFISDTTIASTKTQDCVMRDKFRVNFMIVVPAALVVLGHLHLSRTVRLRPAPSADHRVDKGNPLPHRAGHGRSRCQRHAGTAAGHPLYWNYRYLYRHRLLRLVRSHGNGHHRHGRAHHHHPAGRRHARDHPLQRRHRLHHLPADPPRQRQAGSRIQHRRPGRHRQSVYRQQHHCHHHHRPHSQGHRPPLPPGPPENSQHTGHLLMPRARNHPLRSANADSLRTRRHFTHQHHRKPVLPLLHGSMRHTRHSAEIPQEILGRRMSDK